VAGPALAALAALALRTKRGRSRLKRGDFTKNDGVPSGYLTVRHGKWPIEIDGLPNLKMGGFSMAMLNQMV